MSIYQNLKSDIIQSMKNKESEKLLALRSLDSAIKNISINNNNRSEPTDQETIQAVSQMVKKGSDSAEQFLNGSRNDLAEKEMFQVNLFRNYLPKQLSMEELREEILKNIPENSSQKDFGKLMKTFVAMFSGKTENKYIQQILKEVLK